MERNKEKNYLSIVAVLNKDSNVEKLNNFLMLITTYCQNNFNSFEFVFVDNNAPRKVVKELLDKLHNVSYNANLITLPYEQNKELAVLSGVDSSIGDYVFEFEDVEVDYTVVDLHNIYESCLSGNDIVFLKPIGNSSFMERKFYNLMTKYSNKNSVLYKSRVHLISRRGINRVNSINKVIHYRKYAYCNSGLEYKFIDYNSSIKITSGLSLEKIEHAVDLLLIFTSIGKRISLIFSMIFALISVVSIAYTIVAYFTLNVIHGWTTMMLLLHQYHLQEYLYH